MSSAQNAAFWGIQNAQTADQQTYDRLNAARDASLDVIDKWQPTTLAALGAGYDNAEAAYRVGQQRYAPYAAAGLDALGQYTDASGAGGAPGSERAAANFRASPGYQYSVDQALDGVSRAASATGALGSGNTLAALSDRAGHMADQEYGDYVQRLQNLTQLGMQATGAQSAFDKGLGDLEVARGTGLASLYDSNTSKKANIITGTATTGANASTAAANLEGNLAFQGGKAQDAYNSANSPLSIGIGALGALGGIAKGFNGFGLFK